MTLNTFHYTSVSSKNVTLSVPHLKEIINVATNIRTLSPSVYLESYMAQDKKTPCSSNLYLLSLNQLLKVTLNAFHHAGVYNRNAKLGIPHLKEIINVATWYDPNPTSTIIKDSMFVKAFFTIVEPVTQMTLIQQKCYAQYPLSERNHQHRYKYQNAFTFCGFDEEIESKLHLQSPWHLWLALDHARKIDWSLAVVAGWIAGSFKMDLFIIWSEDNLEKQAGYSQRRHLPLPIQEHNIELGQPAQCPYLIFLLEYDEGSIKMRGAGFGD
ncbi:hypothetical protein F5J12DRAFT_896907 [Pisolithus orientalis]|uniref:uncharacterized protein n=1 Tax=Pisolithus orientalis TaxID=936130 RepID=UPI002224DB86|nr:uncharacterized protein F5J12DRAFT_896907 [Pisolithus orientalis]KAI5993791.1 hypothetical protein F5J12DRAFT_896907 [Pisolithus orientalis]